MVAVVWGQCLSQYSCHATPAVTTSKNSAHDATKKTKNPNTLKILSISKAGLFRRVFLPHGSVILPGIGMSNLSPRQNHATKVSMPPLPISGKVLGETKPLA